MATTHLSIAASIGRMGPNSALEAGIEAGISYANRSASGDNRGQVQIAPQQPTRTHNYCSCFWQSLLFATILATVPIIMYGCWAASGFLVRNTSTFGWAWIICFLMAFCIALYYDEPSPVDSVGRPLPICPFTAPGPQMTSAEMEAVGVTQSQPSASTAPQMSYAQPPASFASQSQPTASSAIPRSQVPVPVGASKQQMQMNTTTAPLKMDAPPSKMNSAAAAAPAASKMISKQQIMQIKQGQQTFGASKPNIGGAQLVTRVDGVFNQDPPDSGSA